MYHTIYYFTLPHNEENSFLLNLKIENLNFLKSSTKIQIFLSSITIKNILLQLKSNVCVWRIFENPSFSHLCQQRITGECYGMLLFYKNESNGVKKGIEKICICEISFFFKQNSVFSKLNFYVYGRLSDLYYFFSWWFLCNARCWKFYDVLKSFFFFNSWRNKYSAFYLLLSWYVY